MKDTEAKPVKHSLSRRELRWITVMFLCDVAILFVILFVPGARG